MKTKFKLFSLITFAFLCHDALSQTLEREMDQQPFSLNCSVDTLKSLTKLFMTVDNHGDERVFIILSHWEINGLLDQKDYFFGFPNDSYVFNRVHFFPKKMDKNKRIKYFGEKRDFPDFANFPRVLLLMPQQKQEIIVQLAKSIRDSLALNTYRFNCQISFTYENEWKQLVYSIGEKIEQAIEEVREQPVMISALEYRIPLVDRPSRVAIDSEQSSLIREAFDNFVVGLCNVEKDWR